MAFHRAQERGQAPSSPLEEILHTRKLVDQIHVDEKIRDYIVHLVFATRTPEKYKLDMKHLIQFGASPRATIYLTVAAKAWALLQGRGYVTPEDVKNIGPDVLPPPHHPDLRGRGAGEDYRRPYQKNLQHHSRAVKNRQRTMNH